MFLYTLIAFICLLFALSEIAIIDDKRYAYVRKYLFLVFSLGLFVVAGFRECGFDYNNYHIYFVQLQSSNWLEKGLEIGSEPAYSFINYAIGNYAGVIAVMTALIMFVQFKFFEKYSYLPFLTIFLYLGLFFYPSTMGQYRQALAIGIVLWAIVNVENKVKFFLLLGSAMMFHFSAIIAVTVLFVPRKMLSLKFYLLIFLISLIVSATAQVAYMNMLSSLPTYIAAKLSFYARVETTALGINTAVLIRAFVFFCCFYFKDNFVKLNKMPFMLNVYYLSLIIYTALGFAPQLAGRGSVYFSIIEVILIANLVYSIKDWRKYAIALLFMIFSIYRQVNFFSEWAGNYIPYKNWLTNIF